jgi:hypothetical protein
MLPVERNQAKPTGFFLYSVVNNPIIDIQLCFFILQNDDFFSYLGGNLKYTNIWRNFDARRFSQKRAEIKQTPLTNAVEGD